MKQTVPPSLQRQRLQWWKKALFALIPLLLLFLAAEISVRIARGKLWSLANARDVRLGLRRHAAPSAYDSRLGWVPCRPSEAHPNHENTQVTITPDGFRDNGNNDLKLQGRPILAAGDSFTFGSEVSDHESWPSHLERILKRPVLNAGVGGYGLDQTVLRAELVLEQHPEIAALVVSFIPDDILRCQQSVRYSAKPYFDVANDSLVLRNVPVPKTGLRPVWYKWTLGYSHFADWFANQNCPEWWNTNLEKRKEHENGHKVAALLMDRLHALGQQKNIPILIVLQGSRKRKAKRDKILIPARNRAESLHLPLLKLRDDMHARFRSDPELAKQWFVRYHMSSQGNQWVAEEIAKKLHKLQDPQSTTQ